MIFHYFKSNKYVQLSNEYNELKSLQESLTSQSNKGALSFCTICLYRLSRELEGNEMTLIELLENTIFGKVVVEQFSMGII
jgi:hypothetical protein